MYFFFTIGDLNRNHHTDMWGFVNNSVSVPLADLNLPTIPEPVNTPLPEISEVQVSEQFVDKLFDKLLGKLSDKLDQFSKQNAPDECIYVRSLSGDQYACKFHQDDTIEQIAFQLYKQKPEWHPSRQRIFLRKDDCVLLEHHKKAIDYSIQADTVLDVIILDYENQFPSSEKVLQLLYDTFQDEWEETVVIKDKLQIEEELGCFRNKPYEIHIENTNYIKQQTYTHVANETIEDSPGWVLHLYESVFPFQPIFHTVIIPWNTIIRGTFSGISGKIFKTTELNCIQQPFDMIGNIELKSPITFSFSDGTVKNISDYIQEFQAKRHYIKVSFCYIGRGNSV